MTTKQILFGILFTFTMLLTGCVGCGDEIKKEEKATKAKTETKEEGLAGALKQLEEALDDANTGEKKPPIDKQKLKALFPDNIAGLKRVSREVQSGGVGGINGTHANAVFKGDKTKLEMSVVDGGGFGSSLMDIAGKNFNLEVDKETENGYERTTEIDGHRALEKFNSKTMRGEINIFAYKKQFFVSVKGKGLDMDVIHKALKKLLADLEDLT